MILVEARTRSPIGSLVVHLIQGAVCGISFEHRLELTNKFLRGRFGEFSVESRKDPERVISKLRSYFKGNLTALDSIKVDTGGTPFQQLVWRALRRIPLGKTISYGELARRIRRPAAFRAVGAANGTNPVSIVIPCHRVIGADGRLTGFGGGLDRKQWLLRHEGAPAAAQHELFS
jgi:methylated-DNA-[protein]-cysteine S-methyltransferase